MRKTKLALTFGILALTAYGCGDSDTKVTKKDAAPGAEAGVVKHDATPFQNPDTTTGNNDVSVAQPETAKPVDADLGVDGPAGKLDTATTPPVDAGVGVDGPAIIPVDGGKRDTGVTVDGGAPSDAPAQTDGTTTITKCNYPSCLVDLAKGCEPSGACVEQTTTPDAGALGSYTSTTNTCYANGVKSQMQTAVTIDMTTFTMSATMTVVTKKASGICYTLEANLADATATMPTVVTYTLKNPAGATLGTVVVDSTAQTQTITCTGQAPVVLPTNCDDSSGADASASETCSTGSCTF